MTDAWQNQGDAVGTILFLHIEKSVNFVLLFVGHGLRVQQKQNKINTFLYVEEQETSCVLTKFGSKSKMH